MFSLLETMMHCGTMIVLAFLVLLALPQCKLRNVCLETSGWLAAALCAHYVVCPIDLIPDCLPGIGWVDDAGALLGGIISASIAYRAGKAREEGDAKDRGTPSKVA
jgi:uncharacterized membrane protein YkvA (DUF1232 family)